MVAVGAAGDRSNWQAAISGILCSNRVRNHSGRTAEYWVRFRQACVMVRFIPSVESRSLSTVFGQQGIHIVADTVPEVVADGTYGSIAKFWTPPADMLDRCQSRPAIHSRDGTTLA